MQLRCLQEHNQSAEETASRSQEHVTEIARDDCESDEEAEYSAEVQQVCNLATLYIIGSR